MDFRKRKYDFPGIRYVPKNLNPDEIEKRLHTEKPSAISLVPPPTVFPQAMKKTIKRVIDAIRLPIESPETFTHNNWKPDRGALMHGRPGTGKSAIAHAVRAECNRTVEKKISFFSHNGAQLIRGDATENLEDLFESAMRLAPSVVFIDEVDCLVEDRASGSATVLGLLHQLDGLDADARVFLMAATNNFDAIDKALLRPFRFDIKIELKLPTPQERLEWLEILTSRMETKDVSLRKVVDRTDDFSVADLTALAKEAGMSALRRLNPTLLGEAKDWTRALTNAIVLKQEDFNSALELISPSCNL